MLEKQRVSKWTSGWPPTEGFSVNNHRGRQPQDVVFCVAYSVIYVAVRFCIRMNERTKERTNERTNEKERTILDDHQLLLETRAME